MSETPCSVVKNALETESSAPDIKAITNNTAMLLIPVLLITSLLCLSLYRLYFLRSERHVSARFIDERNREIHKQNRERNSFHLRRETQRCGENSKRNEIYIIAERGVRRCNVICSHKNRAQKQSARKHGWNYNRSLPIKQTRHNAANRNKY